jgi:hypothetical protein
MKKLSTHVAINRRLPLLACGSIAAAAVLALLGGCGNSAPSSASGVTQGVQNASVSDTQSTNWSGYAVTGTPLGFSQVSATWTVPALDCSGGASTESATWAGIGGFVSTDTTLIQGGTEQDCDSGQAGYFAWFEAFPEPSEEISTASFPVHAGDQVTATIASSALLIWNISIHDVTAGWTFNTSTPFVVVAESAEWIEEVPPRPR